MDDGGVRVRDGGQGDASADVSVPGDVGDLAGESEGQVGGAVGLDRDVLGCLPGGEVEVGDQTRLRHDRLVTGSGARCEHAEGDGGRGDTGQVRESGHEPLLGLRHAPPLWRRRQTAVRRSATTGVTAGEVTLAAHGSRGEGPPPCSRRLFGRRGHRD
ncbi:conserved hypothetical protein [Streptomyces sviceus ATCC 29083]|uniref:Uncharacterized protein n=1 Tax=Streptomyces sviceus (strain ATCC 29083 / DSM 924 / JCM 4929 / NBRC 13980 / NCIMB 11184 / NRRL 5439 / UC 5370) TaxID=463191 RepID=B5HP44_STRX2|nr:conserved hypothetical protein [Streptomyces sviceus ATCC 29083]